MKKLLILFTSLTAFCGVWGQDIYTPVLDEIAANSLLLQVYGRECEAALADNATGLTPANPEVEFGYLWGNRETGNRKDVSVSQEFDFPTVYGRRRSLARGKDTSARTLMKARRMEVMLEAKELLVELVYCNAMTAQAEQRRDNARSIKELYSRLVTTGQATQIDFNKAALNLTEADNEVSRLEVERQVLLDRLAALNGGKAVSFDHASYPAQTLPVDFEQWFAEAEKGNPALLYLKSQIEVGDREVALAKASGLPKISVGYQGEYVAGSNFSGVTLGVSIPLWENRGQVNRARSEKAVAEKELEDAREDYHLNLRSYFRQARALEEMEARYAAALDASSNDAWLDRSLELGQINLLQYLTEKQYMYGMREKLLATRRDRALALARLHSFSL